MQNEKYCGFEGGNSPAYCSPVRLKAVNQEGILIFGTLGLVHL